MTTENTLPAPAETASPEVTENSAPEVAPGQTLELCSPEAPAEDLDMSFAEMLAEQEEKEGKTARFAPGQRVSVKIVAITSDTVFVSTGSKVDGVVDRAELEVDGELPYAVNDMVDLFVVNVSAQEVRLSKIVRGAGNIAILEDAREAALPVEGKVTAQVKGGYAVDIMKRRAFCPVSQIDLHPLQDAESVVGKTFPFLITRLEKAGRNIVVSRRVLLEKEQAEQIAKVVETMNPGDVVEATVTRLAPFGAFVELAPSVEGLIHISELCWGRVAQADEAVSVGDTVRAKILSLDKTDKGMRISLSVKAVTDDPWKNVASRLSIGDVINGKVVRTAPFGAFVELVPGVEGLVHISEFSYEKRVNKAEDMVAAGDTVAVKIKDIDEGQKRISLSMRDVAGDPWTNLPESIVADAEVTGTVARRAAFGLFVDLAPGITGLLPNGAVQSASGRTSVGKLGAGDAIQVIVRSIDLAQHRISLGLPGEEAASADADVEKNWKAHAPKPAPKPSVGSLGLALQAAMKGKK